MRTSSKALKRIGYLLAGVLIMGLSYCTTLYEDLTSKNHSRAVEAAEAVIGGELPRSAEIDPFQLLILLHSDTKVISEAAKRSLTSFKKQDVWKVLSIITNSDYRSACVLSNAQSVLELTNQMGSAVQKATVISYAAKQILPVYEIQGLKLIDSVLNLSEKQSDYETKIETACAALSVLIEWNPRLAQENVSNLIALIADQSRETPKVFGIRHLLPALLVSGADTYSNEIERLFDMVDDFDGGSTSAMGYRILAENLYPYDWDRAVKFAKKIDNGWNSSYYTESLELAEAVAETDPFIANDLFRIAYAMADDIRDDDDQRDAYLAVGTAWARYNPTQALSILDDLKGSDADWTELISVAASEAVNDDYDRAMFYLDLIIFDSNRSQAVSDVAGALACYSSGSARNLTNDCSDPLRVINSVIRSLPDSEPDLALDMIENYPFHSTNRVDVYSRLAVYYEDSQPQLSRQIFDRLILILNTNENETNRMVNITNVGARLGEISAYSTYDLWDSLIELANDLLGLYTRKTAMKSVARDYYQYDPVLSANYHRYMDSTNYYELALNQITNQWWEPEAELLSEMDWGSFTNYYPLIISNEAVRPMMVSAIYRKLHKGKITNTAAQLSGLNNVFDRCWDELDSGRLSSQDIILLRMWIPVLSAVEGKDSRDALLKILIDERTSALYDDALATFGADDQTYLQSKRDGLIKIIFSDSKSDRIRKNCAELLKYVGEIDDDDYSRLTDAELPEPVIASVIELFALNEYTPATEWMEDYLTDDHLYDVSAVALADLDAKSELISAYHSYKTDFAEKFAILEALKLRYPSDIQHKYLGYFGYIYVNAIQEAMLKGYDCLEVEDYEDGAAQDCTRFLEGKYDIDLGDTLTYFDNNYPDGQVVITNQIHRAKIYFLDEDGYRLWTLSAIGWGAAYSMEEVEINKGIDLQRLVVQQAEEQIIKSLKKSLSSKTGSIPFNYKS